MRGSCDYVRQAGRQERGQLTINFGRLGFRRSTCPHEDNMVLAECTFLRIENGMTSNTGTGQLCLTVTAVNYLAKK